MKLKLLTLSLFSILLISSCKKEETKEPDTNNNIDTTKVDSNFYFKCKIEGIDWKAIIPVGYDTVSFWGVTYGINDNDRHTKNSFGMGILQFDSTTWALESAFHISNSFESYDKTIGNLKLSVSRDSVKRIIEGTFSFPMINDFNDSDTIQITDGSFRVKY